MRVSGSIYLDYQSSTPTDGRVMEAMLPYFSDSFGNPHSSSHILGWRSGDAVETARSELADLIGALPEEVVFTSGATESNNHAIFSVVSANRSPRRKILISAIEHKCVKESAHFFANQFDCIVQEIPVLASGLIDQDAYEASLSEDVLLVSVMAVNNEVGVVQDIAALASQAHKVGALFHCDAAQAPEAMDIDVMAMDVDFLSLSAHKMYGPKGVGALFIESSLHSSLPPFIHGGGQQNGMRSGTLPTPLCVGFGMAASIARSEGYENRARLKSLSRQFLASLKERGVEYSVNGDLQARHPGSLNLEFSGVDAESLLNMLQPKVCASTGSACNSGVIQGSYVLEALGLSPQQVASSIRFSFGRYTDEEQLLEVADLIAQTVKPLSS